VLFPSSAETHFDAREHRIARIDRPAHERTHIVMGDDLSSLGAHAPAAAPPVLAARSSIVVLNAPRGGAGKARPPRRAPDPARPVPRVDANARGVAIERPRARRDRTAPTSRLRAGRRGREGVVPGGASRSTPARC